MSPTAPTAPRLTEADAGTTTTMKPPKPRGVARRARQALVVLAALALVGAGLQAAAERVGAAAHPAPGEHVELADGRRIHLQVAGEHHEGPTVVLEAGAGAHSDSWAWIQPAVAEHATVVSYDRAGLGWSDPSDGGPGADAVVGDLRDALAARGLPAPYVLVGHSLGAHYVRALADAHPEEVAGIVLVDPSHEHQSTLTGSSEDMSAMFTAVRVAARLGILRLYNPVADDVRALPEPQRSSALSHLASTRAVDALAREMRAVDEVGGQRPSGDEALGDVPLRILVATAGARSAAEEEMIAGLAELKSSMAALSTEGEALLLDDANHYTIVTEQRQAALVARAILDVVTAAERRS